jgi:RimJ/RimL family protein N-acetyltransferase
VYKCLKNQSFTKKEYTITPIREIDILLIKSWRNEQMKVLRQNRLLTDEDQRTYFRTVILPSFLEEKPKIILFSYLFEKVCIGYGGLTNIDWQSCRAEVSFLLDTKRIHNVKQYQKDFSTFLSLMKKMAFDELHFHRLFTETYDIRPHHIEVLEKSGFIFEGRMKDHVKIEDRYVDSLLHGCLKENAYV